jgi:hypothetical protein
VTEVDIAGIIRRKRQEGSIGPVLKMRTSKAENQLYGRPRNYNKGLGQIFAGDIVTAIAARQPITLFLCHFKGWGTSKFLGEGPLLRKGHSAEPLTSRLWRDA